LTRVSSRFQASLIEKKYDGSYVTSGNCHDPRGDEHLEWCVAAAGLKHSTLVPSILLCVALERGDIHMDETLERKLNGLPMPRPLGDPLMFVARIFKWLVRIGLFLGIVACIVIVAISDGDIDFEGLILAGSILIQALAVVLTFSLGLPDRKVNALYLRSFSKDRESELIREHLEIALGPDFRVSGIRDPRKRMNYLFRPFILTIMIIKYASARHLGLEAGADWKARIWASLPETRLVFLDLNEITEFVREEVRLCVSSMPLQNIVFIVGSPINEHEWKEQFCSEYSLAEQKRDQLQLAVWHRDVDSNRNFMEQVKLLASSTKSEPEARLVESYELVSDSILTKEEIRSEQSKKWIKVSVGTLLAFWVLALVDEADALATYLVIAVGFYVVMQLAIGTRVKHRKLTLAKEFSPRDSKRYAVDLAKIYALLLLIISAVGFAIYSELQYF